MNTAILRYSFPKSTLKIKRKSSQRFKVDEISEHDFSNFPENWQNKWAGSWTWCQTGSSNNLPRKKQEIFKNFQATTVTNRFNPLLSLPHWIQHTRIRDENRDFGKTGKPRNENRPGLACIT